MARLVVRTMAHPLAIAGLKINVINLARGVSYAYVSAEWLALPDGRASDTLASLFAEFLMF